MRELLRSWLANRLAFFLLAALTGGLVGLATLALLKLVLLVQWLGYGSASEIRFASIAAAQPTWQVVLVPATPRLLGVVLKNDLLAEHYDVVKRARADEFGIT